MSLRLITTPRSELFLYSRLYSGRSAMAAVKAKLVYTRGRGLGETVRIMLCAAGIQFEEEALEDNADFAKLITNGELLFNQVPLLYIDGLKLVQTRAIIRYLAGKAGMMGSNEQERVRIDMLTEGAADYHQKFPYLEFGVELHDIRDNVLPRYLPIFDKILSENGNGFLFGKSVTMADVRLFEPVLDTVDHFGMEALEKYQWIQKFHATMLEDKRIQHYVRHIRNPKHDKALVDYVNKVFNRSKWL